MTPNFEQLQSIFDMDAKTGMLVLYAETLRDFHLNPLLDTVILGISSKEIAEQAARYLLKLYPSDYQVAAADLAAAGEMAQIRRVQVNEVAELPLAGQWALFVAADKNETAAHRHISKLTEIVETLRSPDGCPWDQEQTHQTIRKNVIEEAYEVAEAIDQDDARSLSEELGDLLLQVALHSQIAAEAGEFTIYDTIQAINDKLIRRHPHVFGDKLAGNSDEAFQNWEEIKRQERRDKGLPEQTGILETVSSGLPAVQIAYKLQKKAAEVGFEWPDMEGVYQKLEEEIKELRETQDKTEELGDVLFVLVNLARYLKVDPEEALAKTNIKFRRRFGYIEKKLSEQGKTLTESNLDEMDFWWNEAKKVEKR